MSAVEKEEESPRYSIPSYFNQTPYYVYKAVRQLLDRYDIPLYHIPVKIGLNIILHKFCILVQMLKINTIIIKKPPYIEGGFLFY